MLDKDDNRIELPYLGLRDLRHVRYMDIVTKIFVLYFGSNAGWSSIRQETMAEVWKTVVQSIFWYEDSTLKEEKLREVGSILDISLIEH